MLVQLRFPSLLLVTEDENTLIAGTTVTLPPATFTAPMESIANQDINEKVITPWTQYNRFILKECRFSLVVFYFERLLFSVAA